MKLLGRSVLTASVVKVCLRWVLLHAFPTLAIIELHPVVLAILYLASVLECLSEEIAQVVVVGCILETKVADI